VFSWFKPNRQREKIRKDRKHLEARARRLLKGYLSADAPRKQRYYEVIAGAAAACEPGVSDPNLENAQLAQAAAEAALKVVKLREKIHALIKAEGYSFDDIFGSAKGGKTRRSGGTVAPKYRNPADPEQVWSGRGKRPRWFNDALKAGKKEKDLAI